ncbi:uncharacterized protein LOC108672939 [Hyalella azteca]|uniref:Uncharacterized protein LOC108672939 n=1 Tax=Hyalella azteca TaxID=294128 RepID=A0A8B7NR75_HYAAZ|nr:uncharacterized protein LOC108672939 [Hyalella azteca]
MGCTMKCLWGGLLVAALLVTAENLVGPVKQNYAKIRVSRYPNTFTSDCIKMDVNVEFSKYTTRRTNKTYTRQLVSVDYMTCFLKVRGTNLGQLKFADCADASAAQGFASFSLQRDSCFAMNGTPAAMFVGCSGNLETVYVNTGEKFLPEFHFENFTEDSDVAGLTVKYEDVGECADLTTYELTFLDQTVAVTRATANRIAYAFTQCVDVTFTLVRYLGGLEIENRSVTQDFAPKGTYFDQFVSI